MTTPATREMRAAMNVPFVESLIFTYQDARYDFTGWTGALQVRIYPGAPGDPMLSLGNVTSDVQGVRLLPGGTVQIIISETSFESAAFAAAMAGFEPGDEAVFAYDLILTDPTGFQQRFAKGDFILEAGVTDNA